MGLFTDSTFEVREKTGTKPADEWLDCWKRRGWWDSVDGWEGGGLVAWNELMEGEGVVRRGMLM